MTTVNGLLPCNQNSNTHKYGNLRSEKVLGVALPRLFLTRRTSSFTYVWLELDFVLILEEELDTMGTVPATSQRTAVSVMAR